jgi:hypothetical protein
MIKSALSQKSVSPYLIGATLVVVAILAGWLVVDNLPAISSPSADTGSSVEASGSSSTAIDPADRKFFDAGYMALLMREQRIGSLANVDPADRKFFTNRDVYGSRTSAGAVDPLADVAPADRKFYSNRAVYGGLGPASNIDSLASVDPADRKFFTNRDVYGGSAPDK